MAFDKANEVGALWKRISQAGKEYMSGKLKMGDVELEVVAFPNDHAEGDRKPDWRIYRSQPREGQAPAGSWPQPQHRPQWQDAPAGGKPSRGSADASIRAQEPRDSGHNPPAPPDFNDDIPW